MEVSLKGLFNNSEEKAQENIRNEFTDGFYKYCTLMSLTLSIYQIIKSKQDLNLYETIIDELVDGYTQSFIEGGNATCGEQDSLDNDFILFRKMWRNVAAAESEEYKKILKIQVKELINSKM